MEKLLLALVPIIISIGLALIVYSALFVGYLLLAVIRMAEIISYE